MLFETIRYDTLRATIRRVHVTGGVRACGNVPAPTFVSTGAQERLSVAVQNYIHGRV